MKALVLFFLTSSFFIYGQQYACKGVIKFNIADSNGTVVSKKQLSSKEYNVFLQMGRGSINQDFDIDSLNNIISERHSTLDCFDWNILIMHHKDTMHVYFSSFFSPPIVSPYDTLSMDCSINFNAGNYLMIMNKYQFYSEGRSITHQLIPLDEKQPFLLEQQILLKDILSRMKIFKSKM